MHPWNAGLFESIMQRRERLPHALLVHGVRGVGKLALAEEIAQALLCEAKPPAKRPCNACDACRWVLSGNHPDLRRVEPEALRKFEETLDEDAPVKRGKPSNEIKVEQVRELAQFLNLRSHRGALRIALVQPAEAMNDNSANALLKGLEEPPAGAMFILVSHQPAALLPTIRSRCQAIPVPPPSHEVAVKWLAEQGVKEAERWLAYAGGAPLRALEHAENAAVLDRLLRTPGVVETREELLPLVDALQKVALDRALISFGLEPKYRTPGAKAGAGEARTWLSFARRLGQQRELAIHEVNPRLFSTEVLLSRPKT